MEIFEATLDIRKAIDYIKTNHSDYYFKDRYIVLPETISLAAIKDVSTTVIKKQTSKYFGTLDKNKPENINIDLIKYSNISDLLSKKPLEVYGTAFTYSNESNKDFEKIDIMCLDDLKNILKIFEERDIITLLSRRDYEEYRIQSEIEKDINIIINRTKIIVKNNE